MAVGAVSASCPLPAARCPPPPMSPAVARWNEPNCGPCQGPGTGHDRRGWTTDGIYPPCPEGHARNADYPACGTSGWCLKKYLEVFDETSHRLKAVDPQLPVGGPASQQLGWVKELKEHAEKTGVALDFISTHQCATTTTQARLLLLA